MTAFSLYPWLFQIRQITTLRQAQGKRLSVSLILLCLALWLTACQSLPPNPRFSHAQPMTTVHSATANAHLANNSTGNLTGNKAIFQPIKTDLIERISRSNNPNPKTLSGYYPLLDSTDAFASRSILSQMATQSIDIQYYIWHNDASGQLLLKDLYDSANRGVKVRLLLDDLNTNPALDQQLLAFASHPNIQVRLINPKAVRSFTPANFVLALPRYQHRMHNKSMTFDHQLSIIGGRNIGDEYLRNDTDNEFADLDVLLAGKMVGDVEASFEQYWQSELAYDIENLVKPIDPNEPVSPIRSAFLRQLNKLAPNYGSQLVNSSQLYRVTNGAVIDQKLLHKKVNFRWQPIYFFADDVKKLRNQDVKSSRLVNQLRTKLGTPKHEFSIISSYFVPSPLGVAQLQQLANDGVKIRILTNSFDATDVPIVHAGYSESRPALLKSGIDLYELKSDANPDFREKKRNFTRDTGNTSLHTKAFAVDDKYTFIGSYNVDPRSANINTELGVVIADPVLANAVHRAFDDDLLKISYRLSLTDNQHLNWHTYPSPSASQSNPTLQTKTKEPRISRLNALWIKVFAGLPIDWLL
ncbi:MULTISPECIES: phospholipase D family protein [unclassified Moraxella]|uniref:phospholipase D family protein n=1 Tax=unclassified Moraxella TaxID=2685852 RepID=UPI003AF58B12